MNEEAKQEHIQECISEAEQQMKWTPSIQEVKYLGDTKVGGLFEIRLS